MSVPDYQSIMLPLLDLSRNHQEHRLRDVQDPLAAHFSLTAEEQDERLQSGRRRFGNRIAWAKTYLEKAGLLERTKRGHFQISPRGLEVLASKPEQITVDFLDRFPEFREFRRGTGESGKQTSPQPDVEATPEEALETAFGELQAELAAEVLQHIKALSPESFERLVLDVMLAMGYGEGRTESGMTTERGADGGIDGLINEDRLGLDVIYLQAKRWENPVGRPEIQKFVGALHGRRARKGVFITTSRFTPDADTYVETIDPKVVLIDGPKLARLMVQHGVGVSTVDTLEVRRIDSDYFIEE